MQPRIFANSNGTLVEGIESSNFDDLEALDQGIHERLKVDKERWFHQYITLCDQVNRAGKYNARPVHKADVFLQSLGESRISLFAAGSPQYLRDVYQRNGLGGHIASYYSVLDDELRGNEPLLWKDEAGFEKVKAVARAHGEDPLVYLTHKLAEAELGAKVFGVGVFIDPKTDAAYRKRRTDQEIIVVNDLADPVVRTLLAYTNIPLQP